MAVKHTTAPDGTFSATGNTEWARAHTIDPGTISTTELGGDITTAGKAILDDASAAAQRTTLGLAIGTNVQAWDADLDAIAALTSAADKLPYATGAQAWALTDFTAAGRALVDDASAAAQRTTLGLVIGTDVHAYDSGLLTGATIAVTGAVTATISRWHRCTGTTADYTVTLPAVSGNDGKEIGFIMDDGLTKLVTLDGNSAETINGSLTRMMWKGEGARLRVENGQWVKVGGIFKPMYAQMQLATQQGPGVAVPNATVFTILLETSVLDNTGVMVETGSNRIRIKRPGTYNASLLATYTGAITQILQGRLTQNGTLVDLGPANTYHASAYAGAGFVGPFVAAAEDLITLQGYQNSGGTSVFVLNTLNQTYLAVTEIQTW